MVVTVASTSAVRRTGSALRAAVVRIAVTGGLTLLACVFGSAVASAACSSDNPPANAIANTLQSDVSNLVNGLFGDLGGHHHQHVGRPGGGISAIQPPADDADNGGTADNHANQGEPAQSPTSGSGGSNSGWQGGSDSGNDVWTGSTTVTAPPKTTPEPPKAPAPPASPPVTHVQPQTPPPPARTVEQQAPKQAEPSMGASTGVVPDVPRNPIDLPLQQPAAQPISSPSTGGATSHDLGSANGLSGVVPPGTGFRPSPGSTTEEHSAKRVSDGVPGLPSTSPD